MIKQRDNLVWIKTNAVLRRGLLSFPLVQSRSFIVNEYPKSGGSWLTEMLSELLDMPFARNRLPYLRMQQIFHGHIWEQSKNKGIKKVLLWRDGRDVLVSLYYHSLFYNDKGNKILVDYTRARVPFKDYVNINANLPAFMDYVFSGHAKPAVTWQQFADTWANASNVIHTKYESLFDACGPELKRILDGLGYSYDERKITHVVDRYSIGRQMDGNSSQPLTNDSRLGFVRKGGYGGWRDVFSPEAAEIFAKHCGRALVTLGYESDDAWVKTVG